MDSRPVSRWLLLFGALVLAGVAEWLFFKAPGLRAWLWGIGSGLGVGYPHRWREGRRLRWLVESARRARGVAS